VTTPSRRAGVVERFDVEVGLGVVRTDDGSAFDFHCVAIADGSRNVAPGTAVEFEVLPKLGRLEAWAIQPR
jgi:cold shock CspA family protein